MDSIKRDYKSLVFSPVGVCCREINITLDGDGVIKSLDFVGGCNGNLQGISSLVIGQKAESVIERLQGIRCNQRASSCPDQLSIALREMVS